MTDVYDAGSSGDRRETIVQPPNNLQYIVAIVTMAFLSTSAVVAVTVFRAGTDNAAIITAIVGLTMPTTLSLLAFMKAQETHLSVNSRLDAFMAQARFASHAQGMMDGRKEGRDAANERTDQLHAQLAPQLAPQAVLPQAPQHVESVNVVAGTVNVSKAKAKE